MLAGWFDARGAGEKPKTDDEFWNRTHALAMIKLERNR
jgi:hypothetical protein